jgi:hypothetical protein
MPERTLIATLTKLEVLNAAASIAMVIALVTACVLLRQTYLRLGAMEEQLVERNVQGTRNLTLSDERNAQGYRQLQLLEEAVRRLDP